MVDHAAAFIEALRPDGRPRFQTITVSFRSAPRSSRFRQRSVRRDRCRRGAGASVRRDAFRYGIRIGSRLTPGGSRPIRPFAFIRG